MRIGAFRIDIEFLAEIPGRDGPLDFPEIDEIAGFLGIMRQRKIGACNAENLMLERKINAWVALLRQGVVGSSGDLLLIIVRVRHQSFSHIMSKDTGTAVPIREGS